MLAAQLLPAPTCSRQPSATFQRHIYSVPSFSPSYCSGVSLIHLPVTRVLNDTPAAAVLSVTFVFPSSSCLRDTATRSGGPTFSYRFNGASQPVVLQEEDISVTVLCVSCAGNSLGRFAEKLTLLECQLCGLFLKVRQRIGDGRSPSSMKVGYT